MRGSSPHMKPSAGPHDPAASQGSTSARNSEPSPVSAISWIPGLEGRPLRQKVKEASWDTVHSGEKRAWFSGSVGKSVGNLSGVQFMLEVTW